MMRFWTAFHLPPQMDLLAMTGMPWGKWFWRDWMSDIGLQSCSLAAQGMWMNMLCVAGQSDPPGYVIIAGKPATDDDLAKLCRITLEEATKLRSELEDREIFSRNRNQAIIFQTHRARSSEATTRRR